MTRAEILDYIRADHLWLYAAIERAKAYPKPMAYHKKKDASDGR
jgi:hypothetical protein